MKTKINKKNDYLLGLFIKTGKGEETVQHLPFYDLTFEQINAIVERSRKNRCYLIKMIMKPKRKYSWVFRYHNVLKDKVYYRIYHSLTVDDVDFLTDEFCKANSSYYLDVFKFQFHKRSASG